MGRNPYLQWITVGQGSTILAVGAGGDSLDFFSPLLSPSLRKTVRNTLNTGSKNR